MIELPEKIVQDEKSIRESMTLAKGCFAGISDATRIIVAKPATKKLVLVSVGVGRVDIKLNEVSGYRMGYNEEVDVFVVCGIGTELIDLKGEE